MYDPVRAYSFTRKKYFDTIPINVNNYELYFDIKKETLSYDDFIKKYIIDKYHHHEIMLQLHYKEYYCNKNLEN